MTKWDSGTSSPVVENTSRCREANVEEHSLSLALTSGSLPPEIRLTENFATFKKKLKTHLFHIAFPNFNFYYFYLILIFF